MLLLRGWRRRGSCKGWALGVEGIPKILSVYVVVWLVIVCFIEKWYNLHE